MNFFDVILHPRRTRTLDQVWAGRREDTTRAPRDVFVDYLQSVSISRRGAAYRELTCVLPRSTPSDASSKQRQSVRTALQQAARACVEGLPEAVTIVEMTNLLPDMAAAMATVMESEHAKQQRIAMSEIRMAQLHAFAHACFLDAGLLCDMELAVARGLAAQEREAMMEALGDPALVRVLGVFRAEVHNVLQRPGVLRVEDDEPEDGETGDRHLRSQSPLRSTLEAAAVLFNDMGVQAMAEASQLTLIELQQLQAFYTAPATVRAWELMKDAVNAHAGLFRQIRLRAERHMPAPSPIS